MTKSESPSNKGIRVWLPEGSEAEKLLLDIEKMQTKKLGRPISRHLYMVKGLKFIKEQLKDTPDVV